MENYTPSNDLLKDRVILVTGAGAGMGKTAAKTFAEYGATVVLLGRTIAKLEATYDEIKKAGYPEPAIYPLNLEGASIKDYEEMAGIFEKEFGGLHGILHNAAVLGASTPIEHHPLDAWLKTLQINLTAPFMLTKACLTLMRNSKDPSIVFTTHPTTKAYWGAYGVSKAAIESFMTILADEMDTKRGIRVNAINPGPTNSPLNARAYPGKDHRESPSMEGVMSTYLYLMGPDSKSTTGEIINVSAGN